MPEELYDAETERAMMMHALTDLGFPREFGEVLASELRGPWSLRRMTGYLRGARPTTMEEVADELVVILEQRQHFAEKAMTETANASWNEFLNREDADWD